MRCDANVSIRPKGTETLGTKTEIKNMNSFKSVKAAIEFEVQRQIEVLRSGGNIIQETRGWDEGRCITISMRSKEEAHDYRYFPEPDLAPIDISSEWLDSLRSRLPELPQAKVQRYQSELKLSEYDALQLTSSRNGADFFEQAVQHSSGKDYKILANLLINDIQRLLTSANLELAQSPVDAKGLAELADSISGGKISNKGAKDLLAHLFDPAHSQGASNKSISQWIEHLGLGQVSDLGAITEIAQKVVDANPTAVAEYRGGKAKALNVLVGQVMKESKGRANPAQVNSIVLQIVEKG